MLLFTNERGEHCTLLFEGLQCKWLPSKQRVSKSAHRASAQD